MYRKLIIPIFIFLFSWSYANEEKIQSKAPYITIKRYSTQELEVQDQVNLNKLSTFDKEHLKNVIHFFNFPQNMKITFTLKRPLLQTEDKHTTFTMDHQGIHFLDSDQEGRDFSYLSAKGFLLGEKVTLTYQNIDKNFYYETSCIPNPLLVKDESGKTILKADLLSINPANYLISLFGILENEELIFESTSGKESIKQAIKYPRSQGICYVPEVIGKKGGIGKVTFTKTSGDKITAYFPWGTNLLDYLSGQVSHSSGKFERAKQRVGI